MDPLCEYENKIPLINFFESCARLCVCLFVMPLHFLCKSTEQIRNEEKKYYAKHCRSKFDLGLLDD